MKVIDADAQLRADMWNVAYTAKTQHRAWQVLPELAEVLFRAALEDPPIRVVVEIGSAWGGTLYAWGRLPARPDVYAITLHHFGFPEGPSAHGAVVLDGDSHERATLQRLKDQLGGRPVDLLFIDGDHTMAGALADWRMYAPLVRPGGLVLVHDIECEGEPEVRPAWERMAAEVIEHGGTVEEIVVRAGKPLGFGVARIGEDHG